jgi:GNAT superfamily N-acetyltransferase
MGEEVVGSCAVIPHDVGVVELAKLAVDARVQGHGLGRRLTETALAWARRRVAQKQPRRLFARFRRATEPSISIREIKLGRMVDCARLRS